MKALGAKLQGVADPHLRQAEIINAKQRLYDVCYKKLVDFVEPKVWVYAVYIFVAVSEDHPSEYCCSISSTMGNAQQQHDKL